MASEHNEQVAVVKWCTLQGFYAVAIANGFHTTGKKDGRFFGMIRKLKKEGYSPGFPDLIIIMPNGKTIFIEMKKVNGNEPENHQVTWHNKLLNYGHYCRVCYGAHEAIQVINEYR